MIPITRPRLPERNKYEKYLDKIWTSGWLTNEGQLVQQLQQELKEYLQIPQLQLVSSGTMALQIALEVLDIKGEVITTPFSYVATTTSILWQHCRPVFADIEPRSLAIDPQEIEDAITERTSAIMATHIYGIPCAVEQIAAIAEKYNLEVIYDAAHAFGVQVEGKPILKWGDLSALSFHATKLFHTVEGGALASTNEKLSDPVFLSKTFGHRYNKHIQVGINGKMSELHAAMGLCNLPMADDIIADRKALSEAYFEYLHADAFKFPVISSTVKYNFSYFPIIFNSEEILLRVKKSLEDKEIYPRRYFYPSLNELPYLKNPNHCPISSDISRRVMCLPLYEKLTIDDIKTIAGIVNKALQLA